MRNSADSEHMHRHIEWMVPADVSILEFLQSAQTPRGDWSIQTPNTISLNTGYSNRHASARCQELGRRGLVERVAKGQYRLTELGDRALENEISLKDLREMTSEDEKND